jgi:hypothetical protein
MYGDDAPKEIIFLYELKANQDYKEFTVKADFEMVDRVFYNAQKINDAIDAGVRPKCNISPDGCKQCDLIEE